MAPKRRHPDATKRCKVEASSPPSSLHPAVDEPRSDVPTTAAVSTSPRSPTPTTPPPEQGPQPTSPPPSVSPPAALAGFSELEPPPLRRSTRIREAAASSSRTGPSYISPEGQPGDIDVPSDSSDSNYEKSPSPSFSGESCADSTSSSAQRREDVVPPLVAVEFSTGTEVEELLNFPVAAWRKSLQTRRTKNFSAGKLLHVPSLEQLGVYDEFVEYFDRIGWSWLLSVPTVPVYQELALEFFTTFHLVDTVDLDVKCITFRLCNVPFELSLTEWSVMLGICTLEEALSADHRTALCGLQLSNSEFVHSEISWSLLARPGAKPFDASRSIVSDIVDPVLRICHLFLCHNLSGRSTTFSKLSCSDLFFLRCMHSGVRVNLGYWIASSMHQISTHPVRNLTLCHLLGVFIVRHFDITVRDCMTLCKQPSMFNLAYLADSRVFYYTSDGEPRFHLPGETLPSIPSTSGMAPLESLEQKVQRTCDELAALRGEVAEIRHNVTTILTKLNNLGATLLLELSKLRNR